MEVLYGIYGLCNTCITFLTSRLGKYICMGILTVIIFLLYEILRHFWKIIPLYYFKNEAERLVVYV